MKISSPFGTAESFSREVVEEYRLGLGMNPCYLGASPSSSFQRPSLTISSRTGERSLAGHGFWWAWSSETSANLLQRPDRSVGLCCDKLLLEELTNTPKASFQDKFQWLSSILATQHQAFGFNYILNSLLYIFLFLCIGIVSIRKKFLPIFSVWRRLCFCFFIISDLQTGRFSQGNNL